MAKRYELSDDAWNPVADLFTSTHTRGRPRSSDRLMFDGVPWLLRSGAPCCDMPECFGPRRTYHRFRLWQNRGTFEQMLKRLHLKLNDQGLIDLQTWMIDSTAVRATRASSGAGKKGSLMNPQITLYCTRGGLTTKIHMLCDAKRFSDISYAEPLLCDVCIPTSKRGRPRKRCRRLLADKGYDATVTGIACSRSVLYVR
jgi:transposase